MKFFAKIILPYESTVYDVKVLYDNGMFSDINVLPKKFSLKEYNKHLILEIK